MSYEKLYKIVQELAARTEKGKVDWEQGVDKDTYQAPVGNYTIQLKMKINRATDLRDMVLTILNSDGDIVETVTDVTLDEYKTEEIKGYPDYFTLMSDVHDTARRIAHGVDEALDSILEGFQD